MCQAGKFFKFVTFSYTKSMGSIETVQMHKGYT